MKRVVRRASWPMGFTMTPMIDIIFQLIIFFLAVNQFQKAETDSTLQLPHASADHTDVEKPARTERVILNVRRGEPVSVGGRPFTEEELKEFLSERRAAMAPEPIEVWIRTDRLVPYQQIEPVLWACADASIWKVAFKVLTQEDAPKAREAME